jgi:hypothetical protein
MWWDTSHAMYRPVESGKHMKPSKLWDYQNSHRFLGSCCLCPLFTTNGGTLAEAAMFIKMEGPFSGKYITRCAKGECEYFGQSSFTHLELEGSTHACKGTSIRFLTSPVLSHSTLVYMYSPSPPLYYLQGSYLKPTTFRPECPTTFQKSTHQ